MALIFAKVSVEKEADSLSFIREHRGVVEAYAIAGGTYNVLVKVRALDLKEVAEMVVDHIRKIDLGLEEIEVLLADKDSVS